MKTLPEDFFRPPPVVTLSLLKANPRIQQEDNDIPQPMLLMAQEDIALRLWGGLAGLARMYTIARGEDRCFLNVNQILPELSRSLCRRLALPETAHTVVVVEQGLLGNFFFWLQYERGGEYPATWGLMQYDGSTLYFSEVHIPRFLSEAYRKAESMRDGQGRRKQIAYAE